MNSQEFAEKIIAMTQTLYRVAYAQLSQPGDREDAVQEALQRAWEKRRQLRDERYLQTWLIRILLNACHDIQRQHKREQPGLPLVTGTVEMKTPELKDALLALDEKQRMPILLHYIEGYPIAQVAKMLRLPLSTVKTRMTAGKKKLKDMLNEEVFGE